jgi:hypothetical protein
MRSKIARLTILGALLLTGSASAQGLLSLQSRNDFREEQPLAFTVGVSGGYDNLQYKSDALGLENIDSFFIQGGVGAVYADADPRTPWNVGVDFGAIHYLDDSGSRSDDTYYNARLAFNIVHAATKRLKFTDNFYLTYEVEPDYNIGASTALRNSQYLYGYNNFSVAYAWSERFSTTTSYTVDGIQYEDDAISGFEDRLSHLIAQQFSYALTKQTSLVGEYRFRITDYDQASDRDYTSHYALAGVDHAWSERTSGSLRAGVELYQSDRKDETAPYVETAVNYAVTKKTDARWYTAIGFDGAELGEYESRYSYRTGLTASHRVTERLSLNGGAHYTYSDYDGGGVIPDVTEHQVHASAGLAYRLWEKVNVDANYSYTVLNSDDEFREYDRNRISLGLSAQF